MKKYTFYLMFTFTSCVVSSLDIGMCWGASICVPVENPQTLSSIAYCAIFDATYIQITIGSRFQHRTTTPVGDSKWLDIAAIFKYPLIIDPIRIHPIIGLNYEPNLSYVDTTGKDLKTTLSTEEQGKLSTIWIEAGLGLDFILYLEKRNKTKWYFRVETMLAYNPIANGYRIEGNILYGCIFP